MNPSKSSGTEYILEPLVRLLRQTEDLEHMFIPILMPEAPVIGDGLEFRRRPTTASSFTGRKNRPGHLTRLHPEFARYRADGRRAQKSDVQMDVIDGRKDGGGSLELDTRGVERCGENDVVVLRSADSAGFGGESGDGPGRLTSGGVFRESGDRGVESQVSCRMSKETFEDLIISSLNLRCASRRHTDGRA